MVKHFNAFISFDMEGVGCLTSWQELKKESPSLAQIRELATQEVNAAIRGIRNARQDIGEIIICDSHAGGENLLIDALETGIHLVKGTPRNYYMVEGINQQFDILFFIGYHAMIGTKGAGMDHSYSSSSIYNIKLNGKYVGETEINAAVAGHYKVPLGLVSGDDKLAKEVRKFFGQEVEVIITKYGISRFAAKCRHPYDIQQEIEKKAELTVKKVKKLNPFIFHPPINAEIEVINTVIGDVIEPVPGLKRVSARKVTFRTKNIIEFYRLLRVICNLAYTVK
jgi:D-amino peptidase